VLRYAVIIQVNKVNVKGKVQVKGKGKGKEKVKFTLEQATKVQRGSRGIALLFL